MEYCGTRVTMRQAKALLITAIFCFSALPQASHSLQAAAPPSRREPTTLPIDPRLQQAGGTSTTETQPSRRAPLHSHGAKVEMQRIAIPCGAGGHSDHQRLRCAVQRSSLRAQEVRQQGPRAHSGSKLGETPSTAGGFTAPVAAARGEYLATVRLGTPERVFSVIVDTGSDLTWVQCSPCGKCYAQNDSLFLPNNSTSFTKLACGSAQCNGLPYPMCNETTCVYWYSYGDGSLTTGDFVYDIITMDGINGQKQQVPNFAFGCGHDNEGSFAGHLSKWTLRYSAFGQNFEFSWLARLLKPIQNQKIHWRSVDGLANRGAVRFYPRGPTSCGVELTISYEVPDILAPFASGVKPLVESILKSDLERFAKYAKSQSVNKNIPQKK